MDIIRKGPEKYGIQKIGNNCHRIVRIIAEYKSEKDAIDQMTKLITGEITEDELRKK